MGATPIQWTEHSLNPIRARGPWAARSGHHCVKVSPGCKNCYSSRMQPRFGLPQFQEQRGEAKPDLFLDPKVLAQVMRRKKPTKFFWCDMTDLFGEWVPDEWIAACFGVMAATRQHTHQVLTKRSARMRKWFASISGLRGPDGVAPTMPAMGVMGVMAAAAKLPELIGPMTAAYQDAPLSWPLANVHLGVSVEDQQRAEERIPDLLHCPAAVHWVSAEPLLGPINFGRIPWGGVRTDVLQGWTDPGAGIRWIVVGGESGPRARPFDLAWGRSIVAHCRATGVPVFMKQLGRRPVGTLTVSIPFETDGLSAVAGGGAIPGVPISLLDSHGGDPAEWPEDLRVREFPA